MTEELDETICPVCGKRFQMRWTESYARSSREGIWAQAHYLAHLVQLQAPLITEQLRLMHPLHNGDPDKVIVNPVVLQSSSTPSA